jgi:hypothetical protein
MAYLNIVFNSGLSAAQLTSLINPSSSDPKGTMQRLVNLEKGWFSGAYSTGCTATMEVGATAATATLTVSAGGSANDETCSIAGVTFTAKTSGATGNEFNISATAATQAANMAAAFNASADLAGIVTASVPSGGTVLLTAVQPGVEGNGLQISEGPANVALATFASLDTGSDGTSYTLALA